MGDCLGTSGAAGVGSDIDAAWRTVLNPGMPVAGGSAFAMLVYVLSKGVFLVPFEVKIIDMKTWVLPLA